MSITYTGQKHCSLEHEPSQTVIETDAPKDNQGLGQRFSPTDLVGAALGSCILTTMAIVAERDQKPFLNARAEVEKEMVSEPTRRIGTLRVKIFLSKEIPEDYRPKLERVAHQCPVHKSLAPEVQIPMTFIYA